MRTLLCIFASAAITAVTARAASVTITNPGYEDDVLAPGAWSDATPNGWLDPDNPGGNPNANFIEYIAGFASEGVNHLGFDGNENGIIYQDLSTAWAANTSYTLTIGVGNRAGGTGAGTGLFGLTSTNDGVIVSNDAFASALFSQTVDTSTIAPVGGTFGDLVLNYSTGAVAPAGNIRIFAKETSGVRIHLDNFRLDATVIPEPSSLAALGLAGLLMRRRRA